MIGKHLKRTLTSGLVVITTMLSLNAPVHAQQDVVPPQPTKIVEVYVEPAAEAMPVQKVENTDDEDERQRKKRLMGDSMLIIGILGAIVAGIFLKNPGLAAPILAGVTTAANAVNTMVKMVKKDKKKGFFFAVLAIALVASVVELVIINRKIILIILGINLVIAIVVLCIHYREKKVPEVQPA